MIITVERFGYAEKSTGGLLFVDAAHIGFTCEDKKRDPGVKVQDKTCIPPGLYKLGLRAEGGMNEKYRSRYPFHHGMLHLLSVPGFSYIYLHVGNTHEHTSGCILVGRSCTRSSDGEYTVGSSVDCYRDLYEKVMSAMDSGEEVSVEVI